MKVLLDRVPRPDVHLPGIDPPPVPWPDVPWPDLPDVPAPPWVRAVAAAAKFKFAVPILLAVGAAAREARRRRPSAAQQGEQAGADGGDGELSAQGPVRNAQGEAVIDAVASGGGGDP